MCDDTKNREKMAHAANMIKENTQLRPEKGFRVLITGKGGVGKTTITALLSHLFARKNFTVLAVDEDPQMNLPYAIGIPREESETIVPLTKSYNYVEEKVGARPGEGWGLMLKLNPDVSDVVERFGVTGPEGINILVMGTVVQAATGCLCPENALLESVVRYINLRKNEVILLDTQAGVEHFGRAIAQGFNQALLVTDPTFNSVQVVKHAVRLAKELDIQHVHLVINRVRSERDIAKVHEILGDTLPLFSEQFVIPYDEQMIECEPDVTPILSKYPNSDFVLGIRKIQEIVEKYGTETG